MRAFVVIATCLLGSGCELMIGIEDYEPGNTLTALEIVGGTLEPPFQPRITAYTVDLPLGSEVAEITATAQHPEATVRVLGDVRTGELTTEVALDLGVNANTITVIAPEGDSQDYTLTMRRGALIPSPVRLEAVDPGPGDLFGWSVAIDGDVIVASAPNEDTGGAVHVFRRTGDDWIHEATLQASNAGSNDGFGESVSISGDLIAVGAIGESSAATGVGGDQTSNAAPAAGAVYLFRHDAGAWTQEAYLKATNTGADDSFGLSVSVCPGGTDVLVGAPNEDSAATNFGGDATSNAASYSGAAYAYSAAGGWGDSIVYMKASNTGNGDRFGWRVVCAGGGFLIGAHDEDGLTRSENADVDVGAVYASLPSLQPWDYIKAPEPMATANFGEYIAASTLADGDWFLATDWYDVHLFRKYQSTIVVRTLELTPPVANYAHRPAGIAIDGDIIAIGIPTNYNNVAVQQVVLHDRLGTAPIGVVTPETPIPGGSFGQTVGVSGTTVVVCAPDEDAGAGACYVYD